MKSQPHSLSETAKQFIALFQRLGKQEQGSLWRNFGFNPYQNRSQKIGKTTVTYTGVDADVVHEAPTECMVVLSSGESGVSGGWITKNHFFLIIKAGRFDDEPGRWSRWDVETDLEMVLNHPQTRTARAYWQFLAMLVGAVDSQVGKAVLDWNKFIKRN